MSKLVCIRNEMPRSYNGIRQNGVTLVPVGQVAAYVEAGFCVVPGQEEEEAEGLTPAQKKAKEKAEAKAAAEAEAEAEKAAQEAAAQAAADAASNDAAAEQARLDAEFAAQKAAAEAAAGDKKDGALTL